MKSLIEIASLLRGVTPELRMYEQRIDMIVGDCFATDVRYLMDSSRGTFSLSVPRRNYSSRRSSLD